MRSAKEAHIGDTLHLKEEPVEPFPGFKPAQPMVFAGLFPMDQSLHVEMKSALERLTLNDSAVTITTESRYFILIKFNHKKLNSFSFFKHRILVQL